MAARRNYLKGRAGRGVAVAVCVVWLVAFGQIASASAPFVWDTGVGAEPANRISFLRTFNNGVALEDHRLAKLLRANVGEGKRWVAADIVMQQCFGGGFVNDVVGTGLPVSITTSTSWREFSWTIQEAQGNAAAVQNYTRAWLDAASAHPDAGMRELAFRGRQDDWAGPISNVFQPNRPEHPDYGSVGDPGNANDLRRPVESAGERVFTGIGIFGWPPSLAPRHLINAQRVANLMRPRTDAARIATIYQDGSISSIAAANVVRPDTAVLPTLAVSGSSSIANLDAIFDGSLFAAQKQAGDRLLFYVTGHGGAAVKEKFGVEVIDSNNDQVTDLVRYRSRFATYDPQAQDPRHERRADIFSDPLYRPNEAGGVGEATYNPTMFGDSDEPAIDQVQLHLTQALPDDAELWINGVDVTASVVNLTLTDPSLIRRLPTFSDTEAPLDAPYVLQVEAPRELLLAQSIDGALDIEFRHALGIGDEFLLATSVFAGDVEIVSINVPEPAVAPTALALLLALRRPGARGGAWARTADARRAFRPRRTGLLMFAA